MNGWDLSREHYCEICNCSEFDPCEGGCAWSYRYLERGRFLCTNCEAIEIVLEINMAALQILRRGFYGEAKEERHKLDGRNMESGCRLHENF